MLAVKARYGGRSPPKSGQSFGEGGLGLNLSTAGKIMWYVYILECINNKLYTGCTNDLKDRIEKHIKGYVPATKNIRPVKLCCYFAFKDKSISFEFEKYLKSGSGRAFINKHIIKREIGKKLKSATALRDVRAVERDGSLCAVYNENKY